MQTFTLPEQRTPRRLQARIAKLTPSVFRAALAMSVVAISLLSLPTTSHALAFYPSESEWVTWPDYCRARYVVSAAGSTSTYVNRVSASEVAYYRKQIGESAWEYLHHYCAGIVHLKRAAAAESEQRREFYLGEAQREISSQYALLDARDPMFTTVSSSMAELSYKRGNLEAAVEFLKRVIEAQPMASSAYAHAAILYRKANRLEDGLDILKQGNVATDGTSSELNYLLGLFYVDLNELDLAVEHAERAYELGYPLPGLATKLKRRGRPLD